MGIDPGLQRTGYGLIDVEQGRVRLVEAGIVAAKVKQALELRLQEIFEGLRDVMAEFHPEAVAVEQLFSVYNHPKTAILMGHARGVIFLAAAQAGVPVISYTPNRVKQVVTNAGHASKIQVQKSVQQIFGLREIPQPPDVADALAIALCHARYLEVRSLEK